MDKKTIVSEVNETITGLRDIPDGGVKEGALDALETILHFTANSDSVEEILEQCRSVREKFRPYELEDSVACGICFVMVWAEQKFGKQVA